MLKIFFIIIKINYISKINGFQLSPDSCITNHCLCIFFLILVTEVPKIFSYMVTSDIKNICDEDHDDLIQDFESKYGNCIF